MSGQGGFFRYIGGKHYMLKHILPLIPPHHTYCEVFGGSAKLLFAKPPSPVEVYNDIDGDVVNLFRVVRDENKFQCFLRAVALTPYARQEYLECQNNEPGDEIERARRFYVLCQQSMGGRIRKVWGYVVASSSGANMAGTTQRWLGGINRLPQIHARLARVQIECQDFRKIIPRYDTPETFFYLDPPYILDTRTGGEEYQHEMSEQDHRELTELLLSVKGKVILSGYRHRIYEPLEEAGWERRDYRVVDHSKILRKIGGKRPVRIESLWISPNCRAKTPLSRGKSKYKSKKGGTDE